MKTPAFKGFLSHISLFANSEYSLTCFVLKISSFSCVSRYLKAENVVRSRSLLVILE